MKVVEIYKANWIGTIGGAGIGYLIAKKYGDCFYCKASIIIAGALIGGFGQHLISSKVGLSKTKAEILK